MINNSRVNNVFKTVVIGSNLIKAERIFRYYFTDLKGLKKIYSVYRIQFNVYSCLYVMSKFTIMIKTVRQAIFSLCLGCQDNIRIKTPSRNQINVLNYNFIAYRISKKLMEKLFFVIGPYYSKTNYFQH